MPNYLIEDNINFYEELNKSLNIDKEDSSEEKYCLITHELLLDDHVLLDCNHTFNYKALFNDIMNHKKKFNSMERHILRGIEIRCPYCRNVQKKLLPYNEKYPKVHGVNYFDDNYKEYNNDYKNKNYLLNGYVEGNCCFEDCIYDLTNNTNKILKCPNTCVKLLCLNNKYYCSLHKYQMIKQFVKEKKLKEKEEKMKIKKENKKMKDEEKQKLKEENKKMKDEEKQKLKEEKMKLKENHNQNQNQNIVINNEDLCKQILKTGINKGKQCTCKAVENQLCNRHKNLYS